VRGPAGAAPHREPLQLPAYHIAVRLGCDADQSVNLAKSVTVEKPDEGAACSGVCPGSVPGFACFAPVPLSAKLWRTMLEAERSPAAFHEERENDWQDHCRVDRVSSRTDSSGSARRPPRAGGQDLEPVELADSERCRL